METLETVFLIAMIGCGLLAVIEIISMTFFLPPLFRLGVGLTTDHEILDGFDHFEVGCEYQTRHAKIKRVSQNSYFFYHRYYFLEIHTPFPIKAEILQSQSGLLVVWRIPLGSFSFTVLLLIGEMVEGFLQIIHQKGTGVVDGILVIFTLCIFAWFVYKEVERANMAFSELKVLAEKQQAGSAV